VQRDEFFAVMANTETIIRGLTRAERHGDYEFLSTATVKPVRPFYSVARSHGRTPTAACGDQGSVRLNRSTVVGCPVRRGGIAVTASEFLLHATLRSRLHGRAAALARERHR